MIKLLRAIWTVVQYEARRALTPARMISGALLILFPVGVLAAVRRQAGELPVGPAALATYMLVPQMLCLLTLLRSAAPMIQSEVEAQSWIYLSLRPAGKQAVVLGKYLVAAGTAALGGICATIACAWMIVSPTEATNFTLKMSTLVVLSSFAYAAVYTLIGVAVQRRAMVIAVAYTLGVEVIISLIPATINQFTISFRLRSILAKWYEFGLRSNDTLYFGNESATAHIAKLVVYVVVMLCVAVTLIRFRELPVQGDVS